MVSGITGLYRRVDREIILARGLTYVTVSPLHDVFGHLLELRVRIGKYDVLLVENGCLFCGERRVAGGALIKGMRLLSGNLVIFRNPAMV